MIRLHNISKLKLALRMLIDMTITNRSCDWILLIYVPICEIIKKETQTS